MSNIREGIAQIVGDDYDTNRDWASYSTEAKQMFLNLADQIISYLKSQNVVRRVNRELPVVEEDNPFIRLDEQAKMLEAGYVAVEELE